MSVFGKRVRYSQWDGHQSSAALDADEVMAELSNDLMHFGDLRSALRNLMQRGLGGASPNQGLRDMLRQVRRERRERLERYDLGGVMDDLRERLEEIIGIERQTLRDMRGDSASDDRSGAGEPGDPSTRDAGAGGADAPEPRPTNEHAGDTSQARSGNADAEGAPDESDGDFANTLMGGLADRGEHFLDNLPQDPAGQVQSLQGYEFTSPEAQRKFEALLDQLRNSMQQSFFKDMERMVSNMSAGDVKRMKDMIDDLNDLLAQRISGEEPDFDDFLQKYGDMFGDDPPRSLDELLRQMQEQMAAMQSLMMSMPSDQFEQLQRMMQDKFGDPELESSMRKLSQKLDFLDPNKGQRYRFSGDEPVDLQAAMDVMQQMHDLDNVEQQLRGVQSSDDLERIDPDQVEALLGEEARNALEQMQQLVDKLEAAGYVSREGGDYELTPRGMRTIGEKALDEVYQDLKRQSLGNHQLPEEGRHGERLDETKPHEYGEPFNLHMSRTLQNALRRSGPGTPLEVEAEDFEVYRHEQVTRTATVMLVDLSWSMELRGAFPSAKKVALALNNLVTAAFPRDSLYVVGFSAYAKELKAHEVPYLAVDEYVLGTNIQHALMMGEKLLAKHRGGTKQILMVTDGEPTAHIEQGRAQFAYPPTPTTIRETLRAVKRCTRKDITINTFMLDESYYLRAFMDEVSKINGGRVFYSSPERLGEYVLVDYVQHKRKVLGKT